MKEINGTKLYDINEIAELLGISKRTVQKYLLEEKTLKGCKLANHWYISEENLQKYLQGETD